MAECFYLLPAHRGVVTVDGPDARSFLQGLVTNDLNRVSPERAIYAALLTPQGRFLHDLFIAEIDSGLAIDCESERRADLTRRLSLYKLRAKVSIADAADRFAVALLFGADAAVTAGLPETSGAGRALAGGFVYVDPRLPALGVRAILPRETAAAALEAAGFVAGEARAYDRLRIGLGVPDGSRELPVDKALPMESGFDGLNAIDWQKGCYIGQELTARMRYRALVRKRLLPVRIDGPAPAPGTPVMRGDKEAGELRAAMDDVGLALLRLDVIDGNEAGAALTAGTARLVPYRPDWMTPAPTQE